MFVHRVLLPASGYQRARLTTFIGRILPQALPALLTLLALSAPPGATSVYAAAFLLVLCVCAPQFATTTVSTVLHAGSWVGAQTTAPACRSHHHRPPPPLPPPPRAAIILLATLCLLVATVTLAARCHVLSTPNAATDAAAAAAPTATPHDSTARLHTSSLVLSSLLATPRAHNLPRDISIIDTYSKRSRRDYSNRIFGRRGGQRRIVRAAQRERYAGAVEADVGEIPTFRLIDWRLVHSTSTPSPASRKPAVLPRLRGITTTTTTTTSTLPDDSVTDARLEVAVNESTFGGRLGDSGSDIVEGVPVDKDTRGRFLSPKDKRPMPPEHVYTKDLYAVGGKRRRHGGGGRYGPATWPWGGSRPHRGARASNALAYSSHRHCH